MQCRSIDGGHVHQPATSQCWHNLCWLGGNGITICVWLKNLGPSGEIILNNFGPCRSRTRKGTQNHTSAHAQQKEANTLCSHKLPKSPERTLGCLHASFLERRSSSPCTVSLRKQDVSPWDREREGTQVPLPQGPESTAHLKARGFGAKDKLGLKGAELRIPPHLDRLLSRGMELQASKGIKAKRSQRQSA